MPKVESGVFLGASAMAAVILLLVHPPVVGQYADDRVEPAAVSRSKFKEAQAQIQRLQAQLAEAESRVKLVEGRLSIAARDRDAALSSARRTEQQAQAELADARERASDLEGKLSVAATEVKQLEKLRINATLSADAMLQSERLHLQVKDQQLEGVKARLKRLCAKAEEMRSTIARLHAQSSSLKQSNQNLQSSLQQANQNIQSAVQQANLHSQSSAILNMGRTGQYVPPTTIFVPSQGVTVQGMTLGTQSSLPMGVFGSETQRTQEVDQECTDPLVDSIWPSPKGQIRLD